jgi:hypothetical protein
VNSNGVTTSSALNRARAADDFREAVNDDPVILSGG